VPFTGVTIVRDRYDVPHITATTRDGVTFAMGWTLAEDRGLLLQQARYPARLAAIDAPNIDAFSLVDRAAADLQAKQGTADPDAWISDANAERIHFAPGLLPPTIRYTNRPSGIQQVITFMSHRPRG